MGVLNSEFQKCIGNNDDKLQQGCFLAYRVHTEKRMEMAIITTGLSDNSTFLHHTVSISEMTYIMCRVGC